MLKSDTLTSFTPVNDNNRIIKELNGECKCSDVTWRYWPGVTSLFLVRWKLMCQSCRRGAINVSGWTAVGLLRSTISDRRFTRLPAGYCTHIIGAKWRLSWIVASIWIACGCASVHLIRIGCKSIYRGTNVTRPPPMRWWYFFNRLSRAPQ